MEEAEMLEAFALGYAVGVAYFAALLFIGDTWGEQ
jgi:hypothetical protein